MALEQAKDWLHSLLPSRTGNHVPSAFESRAVEELKSNGVCVTNIEELIPTTGSAFRAALVAAADTVRDQSVRHNAGIWKRGASSTDLTAEELLARHPQLYLLGLHDSVLHLVELYLRTPVAYHGAVLRHSLVDHAAVSTRLWHRDAEDTHVFRMVMYLNDVSPGGGPFEYIPRTEPVSYKDFTGHEGEITNDRMAAVLPRARWKQVFAPAGTIVICDTARTFHHESLQETTERAVVMFGFSSRHPRQYDLAASHFPVERVHAPLSALVPADKRPHVFGWRKPAA